MMSSSLSGQTAADVSFGYSFVSSGLAVGSFSGSVSSASVGRASLNGWDASASIRVFHWLRARRDVGCGYGTIPRNFSGLLGSWELKVNTNLHHYLFRP